METNQVKIKIAGSQSRDRSVLRFSVDLRGYLVAITGARVLSTLVALLTFTLF